MEIDFLEICNKIFQNVFQESNTLDLDKLLEKYAFDIKLPILVHDYFTNESTWSDTVNGEYFITQKNMEEKDKTEGWMQPKKEIKDLNSLLALWKDINYITTERYNNSLNIYQSDTIYNSENIYHSTNCGSSKNLVYCDSCFDNEYLLGCERSTNCSFCIRTNDSTNCSNCFNVMFSNKVSNSLFIQDSFNLRECLFCAHIDNKEYCIANMQFEKEEYLAIKKNIIEWILK